VLFGDGAGAAVLEAGDGGLLGWDAGTDGSLRPILEVPAGGRFIHMEGSEVFRRAVRVLVDSAAAACERAGVDPSDVDVFVPHQANIRIIEAACSRLGIPPERTIVNLDRWGNTSAASIPIALTEASAAGRIDAGDLVLMSGFGAGMTWASALLLWSRRADESTTAQDAPATPPAATPGHRSGGARTAPKRPDNTGDINGP
jgi:3-oxoacyl-[acyl-carrier-protein] synthase-3